ncbi:MAG: putative dioxygenase [Cyanobacteria bacterium RYN_339]|nr:putative dioxygenase [Cyanobacteria bacterium RYN_339]
MPTTFRPDPEAPAFTPDALPAVIERVREPLHVLQDLHTGVLGASTGAPDPARHGVVTTLPPLYPEWLGDRSFNEAHGVRFPYVAGEMANGIASTAMVIAQARASMLGFFGSAGLSPQRVEQGLVEMREALDPQGLPFGANLIHSVHEPALEMAIVQLFLDHQVHRVSASAFMSLTPAIVRYAATGLRQLPDGRVHRTNHVFAKISRPEVARPFLSPAPTAILDGLVAQGLLTAEEARLAAYVPVAEDITVEADSGGHTDNRPLTSLFPTILALASELTAQHGYHRPVRVGAGGGLGTPGGVAGAFALGAAYVITGSVNQGAVEAGTSAEAKRLLAVADLADVIMCPAGDMFELGVKVQVLKRGTMFATRAQKLYELYIAHDGLETLPAAERARLERDVFQMPLEQVWTDTQTYFERRDPSQNERALRDPKHRMALVFRWYLGQSSRWAIDGVPTRKLDYQIWCGPAMGAFNQWAKGSFLEAPEQRGVVQIALNLLEGAAVVTRAQQLRSYGVAVPAAAFDFRPRPLA